MIFPLGYGKAAWSLKTRALTEMVYIDEVEVDQEGIAEMMLDESSIAQVARKSVLSFLHQHTMSLHIVSYFLIRDGKIHTSITRVEKHILMFKKTWVKVEVLTTLFHSS